MSEPGHAERVIDRLRPSERKLLLAIVENDRLWDAKIAANPRGVRCAYFARGAEKRSARALLQFGLLDPHASCFAGTGADCFSTTLGRVVAVLLDPPTISAAVMTSTLEATLRELEGDK